jgi:hypothetical protein
MATSKIKELKSAVKDKKTFYFAILEDGTEGYYDGTKFTDLKEGDEVEYTIIKEIKGKKYLDFSQPWPEIKEPKTTVYLDVARKDEIRHQKYISNNESAKLTIQAFCEDKIIEDRIPYFCKLVRGILFDGINEIASEE